MSRTTVAVRTLCEFTAKQGDLDLRFTPSPTAQQGIEGHALVASRRGASWRAELPLQAEHGPLTVRGRADGYDEAANRLEEIKTHRGRLERQPANHRALHWAQLQVYGWLLCRARGLAEVELALVYLDLGSEAETVFAERWSAEALRAAFERRCEAFVAWAEQERAHRTARDAALAALAFPHPDFRAGQRPLAEAVWKATKSGRCLLAQAPTGIGKTVGTVFPLLRAAPDESLDQLYFLTAKTSGRATALDALAVLRGAAPPAWRTLELVAREKACEHPELACHGESCPLARGFYDRLPAARAEAVGTPTWDRATLRELARRHAVCPYYLAQELVRWADVVVGDYNHFFDASAMLHALATGGERRVALLVDEAHNLVERARRMYSAELEEETLRAVRRTAPAALKRPLERVRRHWRTLVAAQDVPYAVLEGPPRGLVAALQEAAAAITEHLAEHPDGAAAELQGFAFEALHFAQRAESFGEHSLFDLSLAGRGRSRLCIRNVVPAGFLAPRFTAARSATLFSATLSPADYYAEMLGLPADTARLEVASPFDAGQLAVRIAGRLSTRWRDREGSLGPIAELIGRQFEARPGNYLAFFSSFDYLERALQRFGERHPQVPVWHQARGMSEAEQAAFLARFVAGGRGVGFAVLGGAFAEGVDLPGERLIGAFIATLGLPQVNPVNEEIRARLESLCGRGFDYAYLYPGLQKVVQAAGRVIRTPEDRGVVHLLDERFARRDVRALLPAWWRIEPDAAAPQRRPAPAGTACGSGLDSAGAAGCSAASISGQP